MGGFQAQHRSAQEPAPFFRAQNLAFTAGDRTLLSDVTISFPAGQISGLVGHNGSGKSTLLKLLARQQKRSSGQIYIAETEADAIAPRDFARQVAYLPQDIAAASTMTVRELVACGRYPWHGALGRFGELDRAKVKEALQLTHLDDLADRMVDTLSGGERQRAWIAMLMAQDSQCLLLDEPTSALDIAHQMEVLTLIRRLSHERGLSVVIVLHDINMAARFCDRLYALKGGRLIAEGTPETLVTAEKLAEIYGVEMSVTPHPVLNIPLAIVS